MKYDYSTIKSNYFPWLFEYFLPFFEFFWEVFIEVWRKLFFSVKNASIDCFLSFLLFTNYLLRFEVWLFADGKLRSLCINVFFWNLSLTFKTYNILLPSTKRQYLWYLVLLRSLLNLFCVFEWWGLENVSWGRRDKLFLLYDKFLLVTPAKRLRLNIDTKLFVVRLL